MRQLTTWSLEMITINLAIFLYFSDTSLHPEKLVVPSPIPKLKIIKRAHRGDFFNPILHQSGYMIIDKKSNKTKEFKR